MPDTTTTVQYMAVYAVCTCGCNSSGWYVCNESGWRSHYAVNPFAAYKAAEMLTAGLMTEEELNILWSQADDWVDKDDTPVDPSLH